MDEPLSNLDAKLRIQTRAELIRLHRSLGITTIYVTHDQVEAMTMGQRMAIMRDGLLQQVDEPEKVYAMPANKFVAGFVGSPPMNFFDATINKDASGTWLNAIDFRLPLQNGLSGISEGKSVVLGIRPEAVVDVSMPGAVMVTNDNTLDVNVDVVEALGHQYVAYLTIGTQVLVATLDANSKIRDQKKAQIAIDLSQLHIFDADTEQAIR
jgi:multiple sugar transport system ATP-binding protein